MIAETVNSLLELLKLAPRYLAAIALISGALIFLPAPVLEKLGLDSFSSSYRPWLGAAFLVSSGVILVAFVIWVTERVRGKIRRQGVKKFVVEKLHRLTEDEKQILRYYYAKNTRSNTLKVDDGVVQELVACRIIFRSTQIGNLLEGFAHNISDLAWDYIHENPDVLVGETNTCRTDKRDSYW